MKAGFDDIRRSVVETLKSALSVIRLLVGATYLFAALITILGVSTIGAIVSYVLEHPAAIYVGTFLAGFVTATVLIATAYLRTTQSRTTLRGYRWIRARFHYQVHGDGLHTQSVEVEIEAIRSGLRYFENRFLWTGLGSQELKVISPGHSLATSYRTAGWLHYQVSLGRELAAGGREVIEVMHELIDESGSFEPFLAKTVLEPINELELCVSLPLDTAINEVDLNHLSGPVPTGELIAQATRPLEAVDGSRRVYWLVRNPVLAHRYEIRWGAE